MLTPTIVEKEKIDEERPVSAALGRGCVVSGAIRESLRFLERSFGQSFALVDVDTGEIVQAVGKGLGCDLSWRMELLAEVARRETPEIIEDVAPLLMLAIPLKHASRAKTLVAVGVFVYQRVDTEEAMASAARVFGTDAGRALRWSYNQELWQPRILMRMAELALDDLVKEKQLSHLRHEISESVAHARDTYVELGLLHRLTRHLQLSKSQTELWQNALVWLADSVPAQCLAIVSQELLQQAPTEANAEDVSGIWHHGELLVETAELCDLVDRLGSKARRRPLVLNRSETSLPTWHCPTVRELVCVPIGDGGSEPLGWLMAINHKGDAKGEIGQFGSVEMRLLSSVGVILGVHSGNLLLYQEKSELLASLVRALISAIDAKDRYTSGHSERVARIAVALAEHLGLSKEVQDTIYLGGLLHDIGKIGVDDNVLNKPGKLTKDEYDQIKLHPQLGYDILQGIRQLDKILPIVLYHHEAWDGGGYPRGLKEEETPFHARIVAVADAFDAMASDRPYRKGMDDEKLNAIFREGAGKQWDAKVVEAFFAIRDEIRTIAEKPREDCYSREPNLVS